MRRESDVLIYYISQQVLSCLSFSIPVVDMQLIMVIKSHLILWIRIIVGGVGNAINALSQILQHKLTIKESYNIDLQQLGFKKVKMNPKTTLPPRESESPWFLRLKVIL